MANRYGSPGKRGYDAATVLTYIDLMLAANPANWRDAIEGRTLRRWRTQERVSRRALDSILTRCYASSEADFLAWCETQSVDPIRR